MAVLEHPNTPQADRFAPSLEFNHFKRVLSLAGLPERQISQEQRFGT